MSDADVLRNLDLERYRPLANRLLPAGALSAVSDAAGRVYCADEGFPRSAPTDALRATASPNRHRGDMTVRRVDLAAALADGVAQPAALYATRLPFASPGRSAYLWALVPAAHAGPVIEDSLTLIAAIVARESDLNAELDGMASELAERYEELNLLYHTEDQVNYFAEGQEALNQLVGNCCSYLNACLACLIMRDKGLTISRESGHWNTADRDAVVENLESAVYDYVLANEEPLVIHGASSPEPLRFWRAAPHRLLAVPVRDGKGGVTGILVLVNSDDRPKFSNSDKNLLQVMARKAAKIVQVSYDPLTGLINRNGFEFFAEKRLADAKKHGSRHCVLHFDIDQLHVVNDTVSHDAGDAVIQAVASTLRRGVRDSDVVVRLGGDELAILIANCAFDRAAAIADKLRESVAGLLIPRPDRTLSVTVSVGAAPIDADTESTAAALAAAELACDAAKELGKNRVHCYERSDSGLIRRHHEMKSFGTIRDALAENRFELYAQPIEPLAEPCSRLHLEVLLRLRAAEGGLLPPAEFLPAAERYHLMPEIDRWVVTNVVAFLDEHGASLYRDLELIAINLSGQSLRDPKFVDFLRTTLATLALPLDRVCFEITETAAVGDLDAARTFITELRNDGCHFALDDFGTGLSSFSYLRSLPVDYLKIDGAIVKEIDRDPIAASMVAAVQQVADVMRVKTVAEFAETGSIIAELRKMRVSFAQGYAVGRPKPLVEYVEPAAASKPAFR